MSKIVINGEYVELGGASSAEQVSFDNTETGIVSTNVQGAIEELFKSVSDEKLNEIYSTKEIRIGTWIDGKPVYRRIIETETGSELDTPNAVGSYSDFNIDTLTEIRATITHSDSTKMIFPYYIHNTPKPEYGSIYLQGFSKNIVEWHSISQCNSRKFIVVLEYTKTTDSDAPQQSKTAGAAQDGTVKDNTIGDSMFAVTGQVTDCI